MNFKEIFGKNVTYDDVKSDIYWYMLFGIYLRNSLTPKFWHTYVITYGDFMVILIVELWYLICGNNWYWLLNLNLIYKMLWNGIGSGVLISMLQKLDWFCLTSLITLVLLMWKWMGLFLRKNNLFRWWDEFIF